MKNEDNKNNKKSDILNEIKEAIINAIKQSIDDEQENEISVNNDVSINEPVISSDYKTPKIYIQSSNPNYNGLNNVDNPSYFFDFNFLKQDYTYKFIMDNQHIFYDDIENFDRVYVVPGTNEFVLNVAYDKFYHQSDKLLRVYIENIKKRFIIPVLVLENTQFKNFKEYGISNTLANYFNCYISFNKDNIQKCTDGLLEPLEDLKKIPYLFMWSDLFIDDNVSEHIYKSEQTDLPIAIWIDENRSTTHGCRIKFQHNGSSHSRTWATLAFYEKNGSRHYEFLHDNGSILSKKHYELLQTFVDSNFEILMRLFDPNDKYDINNFNQDYYRININDKSVKKNPNTTYIEQNSKYIRLDYNIDQDLCVIVNLLDKTHAVLYNGKVLTDRWYDSIVYSDMTFYAKNYTDDSIEEVLFDIYGNVIK